MTQDTLVPGSVVIDIERGGAADAYLVIGIVRELEGQQDGPGDEVFTLCAAPDSEPSLRRLLRRDISVDLPPQGGITVRF